MYCNFEYTGKEFNNRKVYKCKDCGIILGLEDPNTKVLCFKQQRIVSDAMYQQLTHKKPLNEDIKGDANLGQFAENHLIQKSLETKTAQQADDQPDNLCSKEQINTRLAVCNSCEHYKENACMLCGCRIVRESNYQNKLAHKNASCPINKWGPIV